MNITNVRVRRLLGGSEPLRAVVSVTLDNVFAVHDIKVIKGPNRLFISMPSYVDRSGTYRDVAHPLTEEARRLLEEAVLEAYQAAIEARELSLY